MPKEGKRLVPLGCVYTPNCCENEDVAAKPHVFCAALAANGTARQFVATHQFGRYRSQSGHVARGLTLRDSQAGAASSRSMTYQSPIQICRPPNRAIKRVFGHRGPSCHHENKV